MERYDSENSNMSRTKKNQKIYNSTDIGELSRIKTNTNVSIISDAQKEIDIDKIKSYLKAHSGEDGEVRRRVSLELPEEEPEVVQRKEEKDYDINAVLERARGKREIDYEENRHRKINNSQEQIDILKSIKIKEEAALEEDPDITGPISELNTEEKTIVELIQGIQKTSTSKKELFEDLMGSDDEDGTIVEGMAVNEKELKDTLLSITQDLEDAIIPDNDFTQEINIEKENIKQKELSEDEEESETETEDLDDIAEETEDLTSTSPKIDTIDKSFYTNSMTFNKSDFEGFEDLENSSSSTLSKIAIVVIVLMLLITIFLILNFILDWNII